MKNITIDEAKIIFFKYDCSHFVMGRENPELSDIYMNAKIDKIIEDEWRHEKLEIVYNSLSSITYPNQIAITFFKMYDLVTNLKTRSSFSLMLRVLNETSEYASNQEKVAISETIIGRLPLKHRSGLIYESFDIGEIEFSNEFAEYAKLLLQDSHGDDKFINRVEKAENNLKKIVKKLSLKL